MHLVQVIYLLERLSGCHVAYADARGRKAAEAHFAARMPPPAPPAAVRYAPHVDVDAVLSAVATGKALYGIVPLSDSAGTLDVPTVHRLSVGALRVCADVLLHNEPLILAAREQATLGAALGAVHAPLGSLHESADWLARAAPSAQLVATAPHTDLRDLLALSDARVRAARRARCAAPALAPPRAPCALATRSPALVSPSRGPCRVYASSAHRPPSSARAPRRARRGSSRSRAPPSPRRAGDPRATSSSPQSGRRWRRARSGAAPPARLATTRPELRALRPRPLSHPPAAHAAAPQDRSLLFFKVVHASGALAKVLAIFTSFGVNLEGLHPYADPSGGDAACFFAECTGHASEAHLAQALGKLSACTTDLRYLGSFVSAAAPMS